MRKHYVIGLFILGLAFRVLLIHFFPQPFEFDQEEYHRIALVISRVGLYTHTFRLYGYPLFLALLYKIFGVNQATVYLVQVYIDTLAAFLIFFVAQKAFQNRVVSGISYIIYLFNPFTSSYAGVFLTETLATFLIALIIFICLNLKRNKSLVKLGVLGLLLGFLPQVKPSFLYFSMFVLGMVILLRMKAIVKLKRKIIILALLVVFYIIPFFYNIIGNFKHYGELQPLTVDNLFVREFYISLYIDSFERISFIPPQVNWIYQEYSTVKESQEERRAISQKYWKKGKEEISKDPQKFIISRFKKMWYVWEKHRIFPYINPNSRILSYSVYLLNLGILGLALFGFVRWLKVEVISAQNNTKKFLAVLTGFLFIYTSVLFAFSITSERFSIPAYPFVLLYCSYGLYMIFIWLRRICQLGK